MKSILDIKGVTTLSKNSQLELRGGGPDYCYEIFRNLREVYCCGTVCSDYRSGQWV
ncbi:hypothetical protein [Aquimarina sp. MMG016]|uniref:hypothetical protein n=1 Tax=Aquimarina sp. MMG016 TaxID=2822690 RepID=UPI001B3A6FDE|nr:hypothetical protein [Aquimarina sp. MMG016]MBQ4822116.1 hypothetical protein [Aquimarina sp. MMG016]